MRNFKNIKAYQHADHLVIEIYKVTKKFPKEELYSLTSQIRRAAVSIPANIVEGAGRQHKKEYLHFLYIANGSLAETLYLVELSQKLNYINQEEYSKLEMLLEEASKTLNGLITVVQKEAV